VAYVVVVEGDCQVIVRADRRNVRVHVERGLRVTEDNRRSFPERSLFLDGVFVGPPFIDNVRRQYALDHHQGVIRSFTLATCEQAAVIVALGLPLAEDVWHLYVNEPDLDALFAVWVLLHHELFVDADRSVLRSVVPLLRVEGNIDTFGFELAALTGLSPQRYVRERRRIERLRHREVLHRRTSEWASLDWLAYSRTTLEEIDEEFKAVLRAKSGKDVVMKPRDERKVAVWIQSPLGIYEVEEALRIRYGDALARIVLERGDGRFTLLQCDPFMAKNLEDLYPLLDAADAHADPKEADGWGGSAEIGGSPRRQASALCGADVLRLVAGFDALEPVAIMPRAR
jgi:hypothetical protein